MRAAAATCACGLALLLLTASAGAHKGITSKFTYNADVYPVFLNRCGRCHIDGGVGPMSLLKYDDAFPWAESIRAELLSAYLPSAHADAHDFVKAAHRQIPARELDIVLDWATGGTPEGDKTATPQAPAFRNDWPAGPPSVTVSMAAPYQMPAAALEATEEVVMPVHVETPRRIAQFDLLPGNPAIVRSAVISLRSPDGSTRLLGTWVPRQIANPIPLKPPVHLAPGSHLVARLHYKKTWKFEGEAMTDQSSIGLYAGD
jgi:hypothetical protein